MRTLKMSFSSFQISSLLTIVCGHHCHIYLTWKKALKDKRVLMNLFGAGIERCRHREQTCRRRAGEEKVGQLEERDWHTHPHLVWNRQLMGSWRIAQRAQLGALWWLGGVGWGSGRETWEAADICIHKGLDSCCTAETNTTFCKVIILWLKE